MIHRKFGLRHKETGVVVGIDRSSNEGCNFCGETQHILNKDTAEMWLVDDAQLAEWVRYNSTEWYNAEYESPTHDFEPDELEVVEVEIITKVDPVKVSVPTPLEFYKRKYAKTEPAHWEYMKGLIESREKMGYTWQDLKSLEIGEEETRKKDNSKGVVK